MKKIDWKYIFLAVGFIIVFVASRRYNQELLNSIKNFFGYHALIVDAGVFTSIITLVHKIKFQKIIFKSTMTFNDFNTPVSEIFTLIFLPVTLVGALTFAKGLFFQCTDGVQYFPLFSGLDMVFIGSITLYLLYMSFMELFKNIKEVFFKPYVQPETPIAVKNPSEINNP